MEKTARRNFIKFGLVSGIAGIVSMPVQARRPTPAETEGPFYPLVAQKDQDFDLTRFGTRPGIAKGQVINIQGRVVDTENSPIEDAMIDLWQANAAGKYRHPHDSNQAALDPNFQGWAIVPSGGDGRFRFITVYPGSYPVSDSWSRPPHIHFRISKKGYRELSTQMYFPDHELNPVDLLLKRKSQAERDLMVASRHAHEPDTYLFNIVLDKA